MDEPNIWESIDASMTPQEAAVLLTSKHGLKANEFPDDPHYFVAINGRPERARGFVNLYFSCPRPNTWETAQFAEITVDAVWSVITFDPDDEPWFPLMNDAEATSILTQFASDRWTRHFTLIMSQPCPPSTDWLDRFDRLVAASKLFPR